MPGAAESLKIMLCLKGQKVFPSAVLEWPGMQPQAEQIPSEPTEYWVFCVICEELAHTPVLGCAS